MEHFGTALAKIPDMASDAFVRVHRAQVTLSETARRLEHYEERLRQLITAVEESVLSAGFTGEYVMSRPLGDEESGRTVDFLGLMFIEHDLRLGIKRVANIDGRVREHRVVLAKATPKVRERAIERLPVLLDRLLGALERETQRRSSQCEQVSDTLRTLHRRPRMEAHVELGDPRHQYERTNFFTLPPSVRRG